MNLWPNEAIVAYGEALGSVRPLPRGGREDAQRLAHAHHEAGDHVAADREGVAAITAIAERTPFPDGWLTVAARRLDQGDLDGADEAMAKSTNAMPMRRRRLRSSSTSSRDGSRTREPPSTRCSRARSPRRPRAGWPSSSVRCRTTGISSRPTRAGRARPRAPRRSDPAGVGGKAVHELADLQRCVLWSESLPPRQALQRMRPILKRRPGSPTVRMMVADQLRKLKQFEEAKKVLDVVYEDDPPDHEYWSVDALVHLELSGRTTRAWSGHATPSSGRSGSTRRSPTGGRSRPSSTKRTNSGPSRRMPTRRPNWRPVRRTRNRGIVRPMNAPGAAAP